MADLRELLSKLTIDDAELKTSIETEVSRVLKERGEFGQKLIAKDGEIEKLKTGESQYRKAKETLEKSGIKPEEIPNLLEKLGLTKTLEDEVEILRVAVREKDSAVTTTKKELNRLKAEKAIDKILSKELEEFKDEEGKSAKILDRFVDKEKLVTSISDFSDETVIAEKVKQALKEGYKNQEQIKSALGFPGAKIPDDNGENKTTPDTKITLKDIKKIAEEQGLDAAIAAQLELSTKK